MDEMIEVADGFIKDCDRRTYYGVGSPSPMPFEDDIVKNSLMKEVLIRYTPIYKKMTEYFTDVYMATVGDIRPTYHSYGRRSGHRDYCFSDEKVTPISYSLLDGTENGKYPSDHYKILAVVDI